MSIWHWLIVLVVVMMVFGTGKLKNMGSDLGKAIKGFKEGIKGEEEKAAAPAQPPQHLTDKSTTTIDVESREKHRS